jgi:hypothetical protein
MRTQSSVTIQGDKTLLIQYMKQGLKGDVNLDGARNILDLQFIIAFINQTKTPSTSQFWAADCNSDQAINILDIVRLILWINGSPLIAEKPITPAQPGNTQLQLEAFHFSGPNRGEFSIQLIPAQPVCGLQLELEIEPAVKILTPRYSPTLNGFETHWTQHSGRLHLISYQVAGQGFSQPWTIILPIQFVTPPSATPRLELKTVILANQTAAALPVEVLAPLSKPTPEVFPSPILYPAYPNPFNPATTLRYRLSQTTRVELKIFDILGREVKALVRREQVAGEYIVSWNGTDNNEQAVGSGIYWAILKNGSMQQLQKLLLIQ